MFVKSELIGALNKAKSWLRIMFHYCIITRWGNQQTLKQLQKQFFNIKRIDIAIIKTNFLIYKKVKYLITFVE